MHAALRRHGQPNARPSGEGVLGGIGIGIDPSVSSRIASFDQFTRRGFKKRFSSPPAQ
jgi:hypothetical protein